MPRWVFEAWLWLTVAHVLFGQFGCSISVLDGVCRARDHVWFVLELPPGVFEALFWSLLRNNQVAIGLTVACAAVGHLLIRRFAPPTIPWVWALAGYVAAMLVAGLSSFVEFYFTFFAGHISFWEYLADAWRAITRPGG